MIAKRLFTFCFFIFSAVAFATDFPVTSTNDSGADTLRDALEQVEQNDTITFDVNLSGTIELQSALPPITVDIVITGPTNGDVSIDGGGLYQIFDVSSSSVISNLSLTNNDSSIAGSAVLVNDSATLALDTVSIDHCSSSCEAPVNVLENALLITNNVTFSSPSSSGVDVLFEDGSAGMFGCDLSVQPQVWIASNGASSIYKEGAGNLEIKAESTIDTIFVSDTGTLLFSDTCIEPIYTLTNGALQGTPTADYLTNVGVTGTGGGFGTIELATDFIQDNRGTLLIKIDASGSTDLVEGGGQANLQGELIIQLQPGSYTTSTAYTLLTCDSGIVGTFDDVYFDIPGVGLQSPTNSSLDYDSTSVTLTITSNFTIDPPALTASKFHNLSKLATHSPVKKMFDWIVCHKKIPRKNVMRTLKNYTKHLQEAVGKKPHKNHSN